MRDFFNAFAMIIFDFLPVWEKIVLFQSDPMYPRRNLASIIRQMKRATMFSLAVYRTKVCTYLDHPWPANNIGNEFKAAL